MEEKIREVLQLLKEESVFEQSKNGDRGHVIWSYHFYGLSKKIAKLFTSEELPKEICNCKEPNFDENNKCRKCDGWYFKECF